MITHPTSSAKNSCTFVNYHMVRNNSGTPMNIRHEKTRKKGPPYKQNPSARDTSSEHVQSMVSLSLVDSTTTLTYHWNAKLRQIDDDGNVDLNGPTLAMPILAASRATGITTICTQAGRCPLRQQINSLTSVSGPASAHMVCRSGAIHASSYRQSPAITTSYGGSKRAKSSADAHSNRRTHAFPLSPRGPRLVSTFSRHLSVARGYTRGYAHAAKRNSLANYAIIVQNNPVGLFSSHWLSCSDMIPPTAGAVNHGWSVEGILRCR